MRPFADLSRPYRPLRLLAGAAVALAIALAIGALFAAIAQAAATQAGSRPLDDLGYLLWITTLQATLSTLFSLIIGTALAWALNRLSFPGRNLLVALFSSAIVTPGIIVAFGLVAVWGRSGWFGALGLPIYGLPGVVAAHIILDATFAARILLERLDTLPAARLKTGRSLGLPPATRFAVIDWPALASALPGLAAIIFLLAFTSFPIVLLLGSGPAVETLEVAIYSTVRLDFDLSRAVSLALVQMTVCGGIIVLSALFSPVAPTATGTRLQHWPDPPSLRFVQWGIVALATLGFALPLLASLTGGVSGLSDLLIQSGFWMALTTSLAIATASALLTLSLALVLGMARAATGQKALRVGLFVPGYAYLAVPAVTLSLGAFLLVRNAGWNPESAGPAVVIIANALLSLPFAMATLGPPLDAIALGRGRLVRSLSLTGLRQFTAIEWPLLARDAGVVLALAFCFSLGDLGVIALFGTEHFVTLPLLMLRALGAYRTNDAAAIAAIMLALTIAAFFLVPRLTARLAHADA